MHTSSLEARHLGNFAIYHAASGHIVHMMSVHSLPGASEPSAEELEHEALLSGSHTSGVEQGSLAVLPLGRTSLDPGAAYRVDPATRALEQQPRPARPVSR